MIVYISIGNSDDKLTQSEWAAYWKSVRIEIDARVDEIHGEWFSNPISPFQNAMWCVEINTTPVAEELKSDLSRIREEFNQDSIAWAKVLGTEFI